MAPTIFKTASSRLSEIEQAKSELVHMTQEKKEYMKTCYYCFRRLEFLKRRDSVLEVGTKCFFYRTSVYYI